jgi:hypothetical protein
MDLKVRELSLSSAAKALRGRVRASAGSTSADLHCKKETACSCCQSARGSIRKLNRYKLQGCRVIPDESASQMLNTACREIRSASPMVPAVSVVSETTLCSRLMLSSPDSRPRINAWTAGLLSAGEQTRRPENHRRYIGLQSGLITLPLLPRLSTGLWLLKKRWTAPTVRFLSTIRVKPLSTI